MLGAASVLVRLPRRLNGHRFQNLRLPGQVVSEPIGTYHFSLTFKSTASKSVHNSARLPTSCR
jgi:hypothetical protein